MNTYIHKLMPLYQIRRVTLSEALIKGFPFLHSALPWEDKLIGLPLKRRRFYTLDLITVCPDNLLLSGKQG
jgi:hypothetical protein